MKLARKAKPPERLNSAISAGVMLSAKPLSARSLGNGSDHRGPIRGKNTNSSSIRGTACSSKPAAKRAVVQGCAATPLCCRPIRAASKAVTGSRLNSAASRLSSNR
ncbi:hypothetical protein D3C80_1429270 [compost metagenome]